MAALIHSTPFYVNLIYNCASIIDPSPLEEDENSGIYIFIKTGVRRLNIQIGV
jgi:hypothetical protein